MDDDISYDLRVYAEGIRIPAYSITRTQQVGAPLAFHVRIPPVPRAFSVLPNTTIHAFVKENGSRSESSQWSLFAEGRVKGRNINSSSERGMTTVLRCKGTSADWHEVNMGFNVGQKKKMLNSKKANFFYGFSTSDQDRGEDEPFPGFDAGRGGAFLNTFNKQGNKYLSFKVGLDRYLSKGPVQAAVSILASMPAFSPLFRRNYNAMQLQRRIGYVENNRITNWLKSNNIQNTLQTRIRSFKPNTSLGDIMRYVMRESFHEMCPLGSPPFRPEEAADQRDSVELKDKEEGAPREFFGRGSVPNTEPDDYVSDLVEDPRVKAYLETIAEQEHTGDTSDRVRYNTIYGGTVEPIVETGKHPRELIEVEGQEEDSTAAGKYQINAPTWDRLKRAYSDRLINFKQRGQDLAAVFLLKEEQAIEPILNGNIKKANHRIHNIWASFPDENGVGVRPGSQPVTSTHAEITNFYNEELQRQIQGGERVPKGTVGDKAVLEKVRIPGTLPTTVIKPTLRDAPPPVCNVVMDSDLHSLSVNDSFEKAPTRMLMQRNQTYQKLTQKQTVGGINRDTSFAPRRLAYLIRQLDDGGKIDDIQLESAADEIKDVNLEDYQDDPFQEQTAEEFIDQWAKMQKKRAIKQLVEEKKSEDIMSGILSGNSPAPDNLLSLYTFDELFRGIHPVSGNFPFPKMGRDSDAGDLEDQIIKEIRANDELIADLSPVTSEIMDAALANSKTASKRWEEASESVTANSIWANYQLAMMRKQSRSCSYSGPLNLNLAVGFPTAINHPAIGWIEGTVQQVRDTIDVQQGTATTNVQVAHCKFHVDYKTDAWRQMEMEADGDAAALSDEGYPTKPVFYGDKFAPQNIGDEMYQSLLKVGSIVDLADELTEEDKTPSPKESLSIIFDNYEEAESPRRWIRRNLRRPKATEEEVFRKVMEAESSTQYFGGQPDARDWKGTYPAYQMPSETEDESPSVFIESRAEWARTFRKTIRENNYAIDPSIGRAGEESNEG